MSRALLRGATCQSCRNELLRSFLAVSGVPLPRYRYPTRPNLTTRSFSVIAPLRSDRPPITNPADITFSPAVETAPEAEAEVEIEINEETASHVPWYLQEEAPVKEFRPVTGDHIPTLPENSPEMLQTLLEYTYKDIGLDGLKLFDLRGLDTPAALGANVIMIVGTARSVKHLNVSADRLCRWARKNYKLSPHADGLLGRNELKIKLRRKAKRARAASHAGTMVDEKDDGITTGWICVNLGTVDKGSEKASLSEAGFEGFGQLDIGTSVVVQIFTEEKRADVDLDGLWQATLDRAERSRLQPASDDAPVTATSPSSRPAVGSTGSFGGQRRGLHTERTAATENNEGAELDESTKDYSTSEAAAFETIVQPLIKKLAESPHEDARIALGTGPEDFQSTDFLRVIYDTLPDNATSQESAKLRLRLSTIAVSRQHPGYSKHSLVSTFNQVLDDVTEAPTIVSDELGFDVVAALLTPRLNNSTLPESVPFLLKADIELALQVLERLSLRGAQIMNLRVFNLLYTAAAMPSAPSPSLGEADQEANEQRQMLTRLAKIIANAQVSFDETEARKLMFVQLICQDYDGFWKLWRQFPLKNAPRTQEDYTQMFRLHADLGEERHVRDCLSAWVPMMSREMIPIILQGPIVTEIMRCILIADPEIQYRSADVNPSYFTHLWYQCQRALEQADEMME
ncbi:ATPase synthesis protein 25 [Penicillium angulare]|uniref:ATPase synthesis protein 25 n=1 Tax=Penicillium angulare TaxID=116970 RepID=UPI00253F6722|nr:ATPase synthesis protein 25 [Penicillium angulare]KAJ5256997.1 ATPase synthesis protein 25 [Penicillium angulare]